MTSVFEDVRVSSKVGVSMDRIWIGLDPYPDSFNLPDLDSDRIIAGFFIT